MNYLINDPDFRHGNLHVYMNITTTEEGNKLWKEAFEKVRQKRALQTPDEFLHQAEELRFGSEYMRIKKDMASIIKNGNDNPNLPIYLDVLQNQLNQINYE